MSWLRVTHEAEAWSRPSAPASCRWDERCVAAPRLRSSGRDEVHSLVVCSIVAMTAWVWALVVLAAVAAIVGWSARRRGSGVELPAEERNQRIFTAVTMRTTQGWSIESETDDAAVMSRDGDRVLVAVDAQGRVTSGALPASASPGPDSQ